MALLHRNQIRIDQSPQALHLTDPHLHQLPAALRKFSQTLLPRSRRYVAGQRQQMGHLCQHCRIEPIGLGGTARALGKSPCTRRIDSYHRQASGVQYIQSSTLVTPACLKNDLLDRPRLQPPNQAHKAALVVAELAKLLSMDGHIQRGFAHIDPDPKHGRTPLG